MEDDQKCQKTTVFRGVFKEKRELLEQEFPGMFEFKEKRSEWDYLYSANLLATLPGKKFHGKRNHIARFQDGDNWSYEAITQENIPACLEMYQDWLQENEERLDDSIVMEKKIVQETFQYFEELSLEGGLLRKDGRVIAFTVGEPLTSDTYIVHLEITFSSIHGAYPMINQQFVIHNMQGYQYVNREDDLGIEGLRKAKLSYQPEILLEKYVAKKVKNLDL